MPEPPALEDSRAGVEEAPRAGVEKAPRAGDEEAPRAGDEEAPQAGGGGWRAGLSALRYRNFRLFWTGQLISLVGTWMQSVAQAWLVLQLTSSAFQVGLVTALQFLPVLLFGLIGGVFADRRNKRRVVIATQTLAGLQALILGLLVVTGRVQVIHVMAMAFCLGLINAFDMPARQAFVVEMVGRRNLMNAIALNSSVFNLARIVGPAIGGVLIARIGVGPVFLANAASYLAVIFGLLIMRESELFATAPRERQGVWESLRGGVRYVRTAESIGVTIILVGLISTFGMNYTVLLSVMAKDVFRIGSQGFGILMAALGIGSILAALFLAFRTRLRAAPTMLWGALGIALFELAFAASPRLHFLPLSILFLLGVGFSAITMTATANNAIQQQVPDELRGRVMSVYLTVFVGSTPIGSLLAGSLARRWGAPFSMSTGAVLSLAAVAWAWWKWRPPAKRATASGC